MQGRIGAGEELADGRPGDKVSPGSPLSEEEGASAPAAFFVEEGGVVPAVCVGGLDDFEAQVAAGSNLAAQFECDPTHRMAWIDLAKGPKGEEALRVAVKVGIDSEGTFVSVVSSPAHEVGGDRPVDGVEGKDLFHESAGKFGSEAFAKFDLAKTAAIASALGNDLFDEADEAGAPVSDMILNGEVEDAVVGRFEKDAALGKDFAREWSTRDSGCVREIETKHAGAGRGKGPFEDPLAVAEFAKGGDGGDEIFGAATGKGRPHPGAEGIDLSDFGKKLACFSRPRGGPGPLSRCSGLQGAESLFKVGSDGPGLNAINLAMEEEGGGIEIPRRVDGLKFGQGEATATQLREMRLRRESSQEENVVFPREESGEQLEVMDHGERSFVRVVGPGPDGGAVLGFGIEVKDVRSPPFRPFEEGEALDVVFVEAGGAAPRFVEAGAVALGPTGGEGEGEPLLEGGPVTLFFLFPPAEPAQPIADVGDFVLINAEEDGGALPVTGLAEEVSVVQGIVEICLLKGEAQP